MPPRNRVPIQCAVCGVIFEVKPSHAERRKTCSKKCYGVYMSAKFSGENSWAWKGGVPLEPCVICGKEVPKHRAHIGKYRTVCSKKCKAELMRRENSGKNNGMYKGLRDVQCSNYNAPLQRYPCHADIQEDFFCNAKCQGEWRAKTGVTRGENSATWKGGGATVPCDQCGTELARERDQLLRNAHNFCDGACYAAWLSVNKTGPNSPSWRGGWQSYYGHNWNIQKRKARQRDNHTCQCCGRKHKKGERLFDVHHIKPFREYGYVPGENDHYKQANKLSNLITLCASCHKKAEHGKVSFQLNLL